MRANDIRPEALFTKYLDLAKKDGEKLDPSLFVEINCPGCAGTDSRLKFSKNGFEYRLCNPCNSLYCSPRPSSEMLDQFYAKSESSSYWSEVFFPAVAEIRREKLFYTKASQVQKMLSELNLSPSSFCDVGAGYGIFLEELRRHFPSASFHAVEPNGEQAKICRSKGIETYQGMVEEASSWHGRFDFVISSEVVEHVYSPIDFVRSVSGLLRTGGVCLITGLGYEGFDIQCLQEKSQSVFPPHHLNFLSIAGFQTVFRRAGLEPLKVVTPGVLDVDIVLRSSSAPEFLTTLEQRGQTALDEFQTLLQKHRLSSHVWVIAKKI